MITFQVFLKNPPFGAKTWTLDIRNPEDGTKWKYDQILPNGLKVTLTETHYEYIYLVRVWSGILIGEYTGIFKFKGGAHYLFNCATEWFETGEPEPVVKFRCTFCGATFATASKLSAHYQSAHGTAPSPPPTPPSAPPPAAPAIPEAVTKWLPYIALAVAALILLAPGKVKSNE